MKPITDRQAEVLEKMEAGEVMHRVYGPGPQIASFVGLDPIHDRTFWAVKQKKFIFASRPDTADMATYEITDSGRAALAEWRKKHER